MKIVPSLVLVLITNPLFAGGSGGGGPPAVYIENQRLMEMQDAALKDQIFRVTHPGAEPVYMIPQKQSMSARRLSAFSSETNQETVFFAKSDAEKLQEAFGSSVVRSMSANISGGLPILPGDLALDLPPKIEVVPASELQKTYEQ